MNAPTHYLLDTNVLSESRVRRPNPGVVDFLKQAEDRTLFLSVLSFGEMHKGIALRRKTDLGSAQKLATWVEGLELTFANRTLGVDKVTVALWGNLSAVRTRPVVDTLIAATAIVHNLTLVTRNVRDVQDTGVRILNPWSVQPL